MKNPSFHLVWPLLLAGLLYGAVSASAQSQAYWDATSPIMASPGSGGSGNWSISTADWWVNGSADSDWTNSNIANFAGTAGTVTVTGAVTAGGITFTTSGYTIGGSSALTLSSATIAVPSSGTESINCPIAGTTTVTVSGSGTLSLGATNSFTGGTTISTGATLEIGGAGELNNGSYAGAIADSGAFIYDSSATQTLSGTISGAGTLTQEGLGTLTLTHANTFSGGTTINAGSVLALNSVSGAGTGSISVSGVLSNNLGATLFTNPITGSGVVDIFMPYNSGSENIRYSPTALPNFSGTINLIAGLSSGSPGAGQLIMTNTAGSGITWNVGVGATFLPNVATFTANEIILNGPGNSQPYGAFRIDATDVQAPVLLNGSGITIGNDGAVAQIAGVISDGGHHYGFTRLVAGKTIILSGANTYTGATIFSAGTLQLASAETPGTSGPLGNSAASNPGNIVMSGGTLQYTSTNQFDYSGRFSTSASQAYNIDVNGQSITFATALTSSGGALTLADTAGGGTLTLSGPNTYSGVTTINTGTLNISGSITGTVITVNGGVLELSNSTALPSASILTLPSSPASGMVNLNFTGSQTITTLNFGSSLQPPGSYGAVGTSATYTSSVFTGTGVLNIQPPTYWDGNGTDAVNGTNTFGGGNGNWDTTTSDWWQSGSADGRWISEQCRNFCRNGWNGDVGWERHRRRACFQYARL